jgi:hypothetical protein
LREFFQADFAEAVEPRNLRFATQFVYGAGMCIVSSGEGLSDLTFVAAILENASLTVTRFIPTVCPAGAILA